MGSPSGSVGAMSALRIPAGRGASEVVEKRSSFLGLIEPAEDEEKARSIIAQVKKQHRDARHNCWCYRLESGPERYSDDGEPQGTAGIPMLEVLRKQNVTNAVCVVTRYFGGVLLGTGGLLRAYTQAAKEALDNAGIKEVLPEKTLFVRCPYAFSDRFRQETEAFGGHIVSVVYESEVLYTVRVLEEKAEAYAARIFDASSGRINCETL